MQLPPLSFPITTSPSRVETAAACHRRHAVENLLSYHAVGGGRASLDFGTVMHAGAAAWWMTGSESLSMAALRAEYVRLQASMDEAHTLERAQSLLAYYTQSARIAGDHWLPDGWEPVSIEQRLTLEASPLGTLSFKLDRLVRNGDLLVVVDLKTARTLSQMWRRGWDMKLQPLLYAWAVWQLYDAIPLVYIEGLQKTGAPRLEYVELAYGADRLAEAADLFFRICQKDAELLARSLQPDGSLDAGRLLVAALTETEFNGSHCWSYGRACPLLEVCTAEPQRRPELFTSRFEYVTPTYLE